MKEILKWQWISAVKSAAGLYSCLTFRPNLTRGLCSVSTVASECSTAATSHNPQCLCRSHCSLSLLCCFLLFSSLGWLVLGTRPSTVGEGLWEKIPEVIFPAPLVELLQRFWGFIRSLDVSLFVLIYSWLIWGVLVAGLCSLRFPFFLEESITLYKQVEKGIADWWLPRQSRAVQLQVRPILLMNRVINHWEKLYSFPENILYLASSTIQMQLAFHHASLWVLLVLTLCDSGR